jgi:hypothetical protein
MNSTASTLPDSIEELKKKVISLQESNNHFEVENHVSREEVRHLRAKLFGRKTEKNLPAGDNGQARLFDEAEAFSSSEETSDEGIVVKSQGGERRGKVTAKDCGRYGSRRRVQTNC